MKLLRVASLVYLFATCLTNVNAQPADKWNDSLYHVLSEIAADDQTYRVIAIEKAEKLGHEHQEVKDLWKIIRVKDSINSVKVKLILDKFGWVGKEVVGKTASKALWLTIQHAELEMMLKYFSMVQQAVKDGNVSKQELAMLTDRMLLYQGKRQIYGSQIGRDDSTNPPTHYVKPLEDPMNVDKRREEMEMGRTEAEYVKRWGIEWDPRKYKRERKRIEKMEKAKKNSK